MSDIFQKTSLFVLISSIFALSAFSILRVNAQGESISDDSNTEVQSLSQDLNVALSYGEQSVGSKEFDLVATITSNLDSDRVIVEWDVPAQIEFSEETQFDTETTTISKGATQVVTARVRSLAQGAYIIKVNVTAVKADVNYVTSDTMDMSFNEDHEILPLTEDYKQAKLIRQVITSVIVILILFAITGAGIWLYGRYRKATAV